VLLLVELALLAAASRTRGRLARTARTAIFLLPLVLASALRIYQALGTRDVLDWDETYYVSLAVTAAAGRGLYAYLFGYPPMPVMGGIGYAAYLYAIAVRLAGPTVLALRVVSLLASFAGLWCAWLLVKKWYGSGAAWMAVALIAATRLFVMSNSARMDSLTFAYVMAAVLAAAAAFERPTDGRRHLWAGLVFGLGLEVHLDTVVTAVACGMVYLVAWLRDSSARKRVVFPKAMLLYISGWCVGLVAFIALNILPDPTAFYRTTVRVRVDATSWYSTGTTSLLGSFLNPHILISKELVRYHILFRALPVLELALFLAAIAAMAVRRTAADRLLLTIVPTVLVTTAIVLNNASPLYYIHVAPALLIPMAALLALGIGGTTVSTHELRGGSLLAFVFVISALVAVNNAKTVSPVPRPTEEETSVAAFVQDVRSVTDRRCKIAGDGGLYVRYFADYPYFISSRPTEVQYAMLYFGATVEAQYWDIKQPDVVFSSGLLSEGLSRYVSSHELSEVARGLWARRGGCKGGP
jgi:4-amino-4-deoxy-L-arabinose transferase-like glycosyltransferase